MGFVDEQGNHIGKVSGNQLTWQSLIRNPDLGRHPSTFVHRDVFDEVGLYSEDFTDWARGYPAEPSPFILKSLNRKSLRAFVIFRRKVSMTSCFALCHSRVFFRILALDSLSGQFYSD